MNRMNNLFSYILVAGSSHHGSESNRGAVARFQSTLYHEFMTNSIRASGGQVRSR